MDFDLGWSLSNSNIWVHLGLLNDLRLKKKQELHTKLEKMLACCVENIMLSLDRKQFVALMWKKKCVWSIRHLCQQKWKVLTYQRCLFSLMSTTALQNYPRVLYMFYLSFSSFPVFKHSIINFIDKGKTLSPWIVLFKKIPCYCK